MIEAFSFGFYIAFMTIISLAGAAIAVAVAFCAVVLLLAVGQMLLSAVGVR